MQIILELIKMLFTTNLSHNQTAIVCRNIRQVLRTTGGRCPRIRWKRKRITEHDTSIAIIIDLIPLSFDTQVAIGRYLVGPQI